MPKTAVVVPCYNEARRFRGEVFEAFAKAHPDVCFVMVNDGSTDATLDLLQRLAARNADQFLVVDVQPNGGKAAAVRVGMQAAFELDTVYAGYWDGDLATPLDEIPRFVSLLDERPELVLALGSRVQLLGRSIERSAVRHYLGRVFATAASLTLRLAVYDTQCGAKLFRCTEETADLFREPFVTGWIFDVELIARLIHARRDGGPPPAEAIYELPLRRWHDVAGSKVRARDFLVALTDMVRIWRTYMRG